MSVISYCLCGLLVSNKSGLGEIGGPGNFFWNFFETFLLGENQFKNTFLFIGSGTVSYKRVHDSAISDNSDSDSEEDLLSEENQFLIIEKL